MTYEYVEEVICSLALAVILSFSLLFANLRHLLQIIPSSRLIEIYQIYKLMYLFCCFLLTCTFNTIHCQTGQTVTVMSNHQLCELS